MLGTGFLMPDKGKAKTEGLFTYIDFLLHELLTESMFFMLNDNNIGRR